MIFTDYARYYDIYYENKDYAAEIDFVLNIAAEFGVKPGAVLDMGCGTGRHLTELAKRGFKGRGFDNSSEMLERAKARLNFADISIEEGDLRSYRTSQRYDLVLGMFAVMGYLERNEDLLAGFRTAREHLLPDGLFIFDVWFGPAVLAQQPEERVHKYEKNGRSLVRKVYPTLDVVAQVVTVRYEIISKREDGIEELYMEEHRMRFMFVQECKMVLKMAGLELIHYCPFMEIDGRLTQETWNVTFLARPMR